MIRRNSKYNSERRAEIKRLTRQQKIDRASRVFHSQKFRCSTPDRWEDVTIGQIKALVLDKKITFGELLAYFFIEINQYSLNALSRELRRVGTSRKTLKIHHNSAVKKIRTYFKETLISLRSKRNNDMGDVRIESVSDEVKIIFRKWYIYSRDHINYIQDGHGGRGCHPE